MKIFAPPLHAAVFTIATAALACTPGLAPGNGTALAQDAVVEMTADLEFRPKTVTIPAGGTVLWRNVSVPHTATGDPAKAANPANVALPVGAAAFDSGIISAGANYSHTFEVPGRYQYVCLPHEQAGMIGEIIVE